MILLLFYFFLILFNYAIQGKFTFGIFRYVVIGENNENNNEKTSSTKNNIIIIIILKVSTQNYKIFNLHVLQ